MKRLPKVVSEALPEELEPGDFSVEPHGTWIVDPDGSWRGYDRLTEAEKTLCSTIIRLQHVEEALKPFAEAARAHNVKWSKDDLWVSLGCASSAWTRAASLLPAVGSEGGNG